MNLARRSRLASADQRRVLRVLHHGCGIPDCHARFDDCHMHHLTWWEHGGLTNLNNLLPVCSHHHHAIHKLGLVVNMRTDRTITIKWIHPERATGPPEEQAA